jgi:CRISPR-associated endonuclease/helicase Cas3
MFDALIAFLNRFNGPALCMTATLTTDRKRRLVEEAGLDPYPDVSDQSRACRSCPAGTASPIRSQNITAPQIRSTSVQRSMKWQQGAARSSGVVNTVARCQGAAKKITQLSAGRYRVIVVPQPFSADGSATAAQRDHRFVLWRPQDRLWSPSQPQVCEMSLDIDADSCLLNWHRPRPLYSGSAGPTVIWLKEMIILARITGIRPG